MIKTITVDGSEEITLSSEPYFYKSEKFAWIKNKSSDEMYASADGKNFISIPAGLSGRIEILHGNKIFLSGSGDAEIHTSDAAVCPFRSIGTGGGGSAVLGTKNVTENGVYNASSDGYDGYSRVTVNVSASPDVGEKSITANGTYTAADDSLDGYDIVNVDVPVGLTFDYVDGNIGYISLNKIQARTFRIYFQSYPYYVPESCEITFEYCICVDSGRTHPARYHEILGYFSIADDVIDDKYYLNVQLNATWVIDSSIEKIEVPQDRDMTLTLRVDLEKTDIFINGVLYVETASLNSTMIPQIDSCYTYFMYSNTSNRIADGRFYAARFYNRALTDAEIMHNHEQDVKLIEFLNT